jgi:hypothetical protein
MHRPGPQLDQSHRDLHAAVGLDRVAGVGLVSGIKERRRRKSQGQAGRGHYPHKGRQPPSGITTAGRQFVQNGLGDGGQVGCGVRSGPAGRRDGERHGVRDGNGIQQSRQGFQVRQFAAARAAVLEVVLEAQLVRFIEPSQQVCPQQLMDFLAVHRSTPISSSIVRRAFTA